MASTFRNIVAKANPPQNLCEGIALCDGPGPTVIRGYLNIKKLYNIN
jgi:hypothetical protein